MSNSFKIGDKVIAIFSKSYDWQTSTFSIDTIISIEDDMIELENVYNRKIQYWKCIPWSEKAEILCSKYIGKDIKSICLHIAIPEGSKSNSIEYLRKNHNLDIDCDSESDNYGEIFYNSDERSYCGYAENIEDCDGYLDKVIITLIPQYWAYGEEEKLIKLLLISEVCETPK